MDRWTVTTLLRMFRPNFERDLVGEVSCQKFIIVWCVCMCGLTLKVSAFASGSFFFGLSCRHTASPQITGTHAGGVQ